MNTEEKKYKMTSAKKQHIYESGDLIIRMSESECKKITGNLDYTRVTYWNGMSVRIEKI